MFYHFDITNQVAKNVLQQLIIVGDACCQCKSSPVADALLYQQVLCRFIAHQHAELCARLIAQ